MALCARCQQPTFHFARVSVCVCDRMKELSEINPQATKPAACLRSSDKPKRQRRRENNLSRERERKGEETNVMELVPIGGYSECSAYGNIIYWRMRHRGISRRNANKLKPKLATRNASTVCFWESAVFWAVWRMLHGVRWLWVFVSVSGVHFTDGTKCILYEDLWKEWRGPRYGSNHKFHMDFEVRTPLLIEDRLHAGAQNRWNWETFSRKNRHSANSAKNRRLFPDFVGFFKGKSKIDCA